MAGSGAEGWPPLQMVATARPSRVPPASSRSQMAVIRPSIHLNMECQGVQYYMHFLPLYLVHVRSKVRKKMQQLTYVSRKYGRPVSLVQRGRSSRSRSRARTTQMQASSQDQDTVMQAAILSASCLSRTCRPSTVFCSS